VRVNAMAVKQTMLEYVTATIAGQLFGIPIGRVQEVFIPDRLTRVPLAVPEIAGLLNVRGRIVTVIDMWRRLDLRREQRCAAGPVAVGVQHKAETYALLVGQVGEVLQLPAAARQHNPFTVVSPVAAVCSGVHRLSSGILIVLDVDRVLEIGKPAPFIGNQSQSATQH